jgi:hypothetical protein
LKSFDIALQRAQEYIFSRMEEGQGIMKANTRIRFSVLGLNQSSENKLPRSTDVGSFKSFTGTVVRTGQVKMLEVSIKTNISK